jgi:hypothetical protein
MGNDQPGRNLPVEIDLYYNLRQKIKKQGTRHPQPPAKPPTNEASQAGVEQGKKKAKRGQKEGKKRHMRTTTLYQPHQAEKLPILTYITKIKLQNRR